MRTIFQRIAWCAFLWAGVVCSVQAQLNTDRITSIGRNALYFEDYVLSIQYFNQVIKLKPYLPEPYLLRAIAKIQLSDYTGALEDCHASIARNPFQPNAYYTRGYIYRTLGEYEKAEEDFTKALIYAPENHTYMMLRADVRAEQGHYDQAMEDINYLLQREPKSPTLHFEKGVICLHKKDTLCAHDQFTQATEYDTQNPTGWSALAVVSMYMGEEEQALEELNRSIALGSKWSGDYVNRGILHYHFHHYREALADYDKAVEMSKDDAQCYYNRAMLRSELGDYNRAIEDFDHAIELAPHLTEMHYQRGMVLLQLQQWKESIEDFEVMIAHYPYFLPSYYLIAQAKTALGEKKEAYQYRQKAYELEQKKDSIQQALGDSLSHPNTDVQIAKAQVKQKDRRKEFSSRTAQNGTEEVENTQYASQTRGNVQNRHVDIINEANITLSYYSQNQSLRQTNYYHYVLQHFNKSNHLPAPLKSTIQEVTLTADMVNQHFDQISKLTKRLDTQQNAELYFTRAMEFALVQDYTSAIDDCTKAILLNKTNKESQENAVIYTFCRANWRYKLLDYQRSHADYQTEYKGKTAGGLLEMDYDIMLRDYDYVIGQQGDFSFAYYNKANMLCTQKQYADAIRHYSLAIEADSDFAEAYFNRGLTYIYTDEIEKGIQDLSKAGELGIYQAYNLITRLK